MHFLDASAVLYEVTGQPIEQLRMGRPLPHLAEVVWRADDSVAEMVFPNAIDHYARSERVGGTGDPAGQRQPSSRSRIGYALGIDIRERHAQNSGRHILNWQLQTTAHQLVRRLGGMLRDLH